MDFENFFFYLEELSWEFIFFKKKQHLVLILEKIVKCRSSQVGIT